MPIGKTFRAPRRQVLFKTLMRIGRFSTEVCIRDISSRGMLLLAHSPPPIGTYVKINVPALDVGGRVVWTGVRRFGINTRERLDVDAVISRLTQAAAKPVKLAEPANKIDKSILPSDGDDTQQIAVRSEFLAKTINFVAIAACSVISVAILSIILNRLFSYVFFGALSSAL